MTVRKKRVRAHVIAELSLHHVAYQIVKEGFTFEAVRSDYGYDGSIITFTKTGEVENGMIYIQLKATDRIVRRGGGVAVRVGRSDVDLWEGEPMPVYLVLFDAAAERAYWVYFQRYAEANGISASTMAANSVEVVIDARQIVDSSAVRHWHADKSAVLAKIGKLNRA